MIKVEMLMEDSKTVTEYVKFLYYQSMRKYKYSREEVASRAIIAQSTIWRVIGETKPDELARWDSILNILFCAGVDQEELRKLNWMYRHALIFENVPLKTRSPTTTAVDLSAVRQRTRQPFTDPIGPFAAEEKRLIREG